MINGKSVSLCMVVYNSSDLCENAIKSVQHVVDEIVIVDQGSDVIHAEKLKKLANTYYRTTNKGNGDYDRQYCYALATKDYVLALDADESFEQEELDKFADLKDYNFDIVWFLFHNLIYRQNKEIDIKELLGDDPHPRFWKRKVNIGGRESSPIMWPHTAHTFPQIGSERQIFSNIFITHRRELGDVVKTHIHRKKNIDKRNQDIEKNFVRAVLQKFPKETVIEINKQFPELKSYLKD